MNFFIPTAAVLFVFVVFFPCSDGNGSDSSPAKIVGGAYAPLGVFPFTLAMERRYTSRQCSGSWWRRRCRTITTWKQHCGAALINDYWALSAKHCLAGRPINSFRLRGGIRCKNERGVAALIYYVRYYSSTDFALVRLKTPIKGAYIRPIVIQSYHISYSACYVIGWGRIVRNGPVSNCLKYSKVNIVSQGSCTRRYSWSLCARYATSSACNGDSGGPLACHYGGKWILVGLVWYGNQPVCGLNSPNGYTRVWYFKNFINGYLG